MPVPKYDEMTLPILQILADGKEHSQTELADKIAEQFHLTPEERAQRLPKVAIRLGNAPENDLLAD